MLYNQEDRCVATPIERISNQNLSITYAPNAWHLCNLCICNIVTCNNQDKKKPRPIRLNQAGLIWGEVVRASQKGEKGASRYLGYVTPLKYRLGHCMGLYSAFTFTTNNALPEMPCKCDLALKACSLVINGSFKRVMVCFDSIARPYVLIVMF